MGSDPGRADVAGVFAAARVPEPVFGAAGVRMVAVLRVANAVLWALRAFIETAADLSSVVLSHRSLQMPAWSAWRRGHESRRAKTRMSGV
jgi:hypothetical protein